MRSGPTMSRAASMPRSSLPMWTPSAHTSAASAASSLTMNRPPRIACTRASARACSRFKAGSAALLRYWIAAAPPVSAAAARAASSSVLARSGVTAYRPAMRKARARRRADASSVRAAGIGGARRLGFARGRAGILACPEQAVGKELAHARSIGFLERLPRIVLRFADGFGKLEPVGEHRGDRGGQRAARPVITARKARPCVGAHDAVLAVERVDDLRRGLVRAGHEHEFGAKLDKLARTLGERCFVVVVDLGQTAHLETVGSEDRRLREQELAHRTLHFVGRELVAAT